MATILISILVFIAFAAAIYAIVKNRQKGNYCGSSCSGCPHTDKCKS